MFIRFSVFTKMAFFLSLLFPRLYAQEIVLDNAPKIVEELYYVVAQKAKWYSERDSSTAKGGLPFRETVWVVNRLNGWDYIRRVNDTYAYVPTKVLSNIWLQAQKTKGRLNLFAGSTLIKSYPADFGHNTQDTLKIQRGTLTDKKHWVTPEGTFYIAQFNPRSEYYKAMILSYPTPADAERGLRQKLITSAQHRAILDAHANFRLPPMNTALGGLIEIHGKGSGRRMNWTQGCIALRDIYMDELWAKVPLGAPVVVER
ncbi:MAG: L,D-transpeptidase [Rhodothermia bacterium]|nr:L,D-transpeptidase [Rhodothermia bacterium]